MATSEAGASRTSLDALDEAGRASATACTTLEGRKSVGTPVASSKARFSTSSASAASSRDTAVRSAAEERLAHFMVPLVTSPSMRSMEAASPTSLKASSLPSPHWHALATRRHSLHRKRVVQCGGSRWSAASSGDSSSASGSSSRRQMATACARRVRGPKS